MKQLFIIGGANGSGKSTFAVDLIEETKLVFLNADEIEKNFNEPKTTASAFRAGRLFFQKLADLVKNEHSFILESTLSGNYLVQTIEKLKKEGYQIIIVYVFLSNPTICMERIKIRVAKGGHYIDDETVKRRFYRSIHNFWNIYKSLADEWILYHNSDQVIKQVVIGQKNDYVVLDDEIFNFYQQILKTHES